MTLRLARERSRAGSATGFSEEGSEESIENKKNNSLDRTGAIGYNCYGVTALIAT